ncbi:MAG: GNAT family N-acetyltransferase [Chloroflexota bacterium]
MSGWPAGARTGRAAPAAVIEYRPATEADLPACEAIWRDGLNDYLVPMGQHEIPPDNPSLRLLHAHALATDPDRFWVATRDDAVVGFGSAVRRGPVWFLSMLFVRPGLQAGGVGREILRRILPAGDDGAILATGTDSAQPVSNGLYAAHGIVPRMPMFNLVGRPTRPGELAPLPEAVSVARLGGAGPRTSDGPLAAEIDDLDEATLGFRHGLDHDFVRRSGRVGFAYRDGAGELLGYGYASEVGRIGPLATRDPSLHAPIVAHLLNTVVPRGASAIWVPGPAGPTMQMLIRAGLRIEGFPVLVCWSRPFADFSRYLPISPGLL